MKALIAPTRKPTPMAARPLLHYLAKQIEAKGGDDYIFEQLADNVPVRVIVSEFINPRTGVPFTHAMIYHWIHMKPEREEKLALVRRIGSHALIDDIDELLEKAEKGIISPADVSLLKERIGQKRWLAEKYNPEAFGKKEEAPAVQLNFDAAFLQALETAGSAKSLPPAEVPEADYEVVEDQDDSIAELIG